MYAMSPEATSGIISVVIALAAFGWGVFTWTHDRHQQAPGLRPKLLVSGLTGLVLLLGGSVAAIADRTDGHSVAHRSATTSTTERPTTSEATTTTASTTTSERTPLPPPHPTEPPAPTTTDVVTLPPTTTGPPVVPVPNVIGKSEVEASAQVTEANFIPAVVERDTCEPPETEEVFFQRPAEDQSAPEGTVIQLILGCTMPPG